MMRTHLGTRRTRNRARKLTAKEIKPGAWLVTGGELGHGVMVQDGGFVCDCGKQEFARDGMCSHILAVWLLLYGNLKRSA